MEVRVVHNRAIAPVRIPPCRGQPPFDLCLFETVPHNSRIGRQLNNSHNRLVLNQTVLAATPVDMRQSLNISRPVLVQMVSCV